jgi:hypothetical protein
MKKNSRFLNFFFYNYLIEWIIQINYSLFGISNADSMLEINFIQTINFRKNFSLENN